MSKLVVEKTRWGRFTWSEIGDFFTAVRYCLTARLDLLVRPKETVRAVFAIASPRVPLSPQQELLVMRVHRAVRRAGRWVLHSQRPCLPQAIATQRWLAARGIPARVVVGAGEKDKRFIAHAWTECADGIVVGSAGFLARASAPFVPSRGLGSAESDRADGR
jgi:hypothetical protein